MTNNEKYAYNNEDDDDYEPCSKKIMPSLFAWFLLISSTSAYFTMVLPMCLDLIGLERLYIFIGVAVSHAILFFYVVINLTIATFMDPGRFPKVDIHEAIENDSNSHQTSGNYKNVLINDINVRMKWCTTCQFYRPPRSSHCGVCNACIDTMDHHCPWVCNCIARRNYKYFLQFLISLTIHMLIVFGVCLTFVLLNKENLTNIPVIVALLLIILIGILIIPIGGLTGFHVILVSRGRTTNEQVTGKFRTGVNPFDDGCFNNWQLTLCLSMPPSYIEFKKKKQQLREYYEAKALMNNNNNRSNIKDKNSILSTAHNNNLNNRENFKLLNHNDEGLNNHPKVKYNKNTNEIVPPVNNKRNVNINNNINNNSNRARSNSNPKQQQQQQHQLQEIYRDNDNYDLELQQYLENKKLQEDAIANNKQRKSRKKQIEQNNYMINDNNDQQQQIWLENNDGNQFPTNHPTYNNKNYDNLIVTTEPILNYKNHSKPPKNKQQKINTNNNRKEHVIIKNINNQNNSKTKCVRNNSYINANHTNLIMPNNQLNNIIELKSSSSTSTASLINSNNKSSNFVQDNTTNHNKNSNTKNNNKQKINKIVKKSNNQQDYATYEITV